MLNQIIRYKPIIDFINKNKNLKNILEVWSWSKWIGKFMRNLKYTGLDKTTSDYSNKERKTSKNMHYVKWDALHMPFEDESFDLVFSLDMLEHIPENFRLQAVDEAIRVSKNTTIIAFPYWKLWWLLDSIFYETTMIQTNHVEWRLKEHIDNGLPQEDFYLSIKEKYPQYKIETVRNWNFFFVLFVIFCESFFILNIFFVFLSHIIRYLPISFESTIWVRQYIIIQKI